MGHGVGRVTGFRNKANKENGTLSHTEYLDFKTDRWS